LFIPFSIWYALKGELPNSISLILYEIERFANFMATYTIVPERETLHGQFSRDFSPVLTLGCHEDLHEASMIALDAMLTLMGQQYGLARQDAVALASLVVDLHITQLVNAGVRGVHAILPHGALAHI
jgi:acetamidase/formamidase